MRLRLALSTLGAAVLSIGLAGASGAHVATQQEAVSLRAAYGQDSAARKAISDSRVDVWNWNITGAGSDPNGVNNGGNEVALNPLKNQLNALGAGSRPDVITLQEVCENQRANATTYLNTLGYNVNVRPTRTQPRCENRAPGAGTTMYDLIAVPAAYSPREYDYDTYGGDGMACYLFTKSKTIVACSTQVSGGEEATRAKTTYRMLQDEIIPWTGFGWGVVIAGDFNTSPSNSPMDNMYDETVPRARGRLFDVSMTCGTCRDGLWTHDSRGSLGKRKIDYVFYSKNVFARSSFQSDLDMKEQYSYHRFYKASSAFK